PGRLGRDARSGGREAVSRGRRGRRPGALPLLQCRGGNYGLSPNDRRRLDRAIARRRGPRPGCPIFSAPALPPTPTPPPRPPPRGPVPDSRMTVATDELRLPRVQPRVLRQEVLEALRSAILNNEIAPGTRLFEAEVATRMGVSRAPVRESIRQLEQEGLVEFFPHRGAVVIGLPNDEIDAIYELRALIEERAIERACATATADDLKRLARLI